MLKLENMEGYKSSPDILKEAYKILLSIFVEDDVKIYEIDNNVYEVVYLKNKFTFKFYNVDYFYFSLDVFYKEDLLYQGNFEIANFESYMRKKSEEGFENDFGDIIKFVNSTTSKLEVSCDNSFDNYDEECREENLGVDSQSVKLSTQNSIVPDNIEKIRVVALRFEGNIIAFRFKTDKGAFDMRIEVATKYGLGGFKTEKFINLERVNGILMSSTEKKLRTCVPDISLCEEDCKRLVNAIFQCEE